MSKGGIDWNLITERDTILPFVHPQSAKALTPEDHARQNIDQQLNDCGWIVQGMSDMNMMAGLGVAVREFQLTSGEADYGSLVIDSQSLKSVTSDAVTQLNEIEADPVRSALLPFLWRELREILLRPEHQVIDKFTRNQLLTSSFDPEAKQRAKTNTSSKRKRVDHQNVSGKALAAGSSTKRKGSEVSEGDAYEDIPGFCKSATLGEIAEQGYVLTPGRYVGAEEVEDGGVLFVSKPKRGLTRELATQFHESEKLQAAIRDTVLPKSISLDLRILNNEKLRNA